MASDRKTYVVSLLKRDKTADYRRFEQFIAGNVSFGFGEDSYLINLKNQASLDELVEALKQVIQPDDKLLIAEVLEWRSHPRESPSPHANA